NVHRKLKKRSGTQWTEDLGCSISVTDRLVVSGTGVVRETGLLQDPGSLGVLQQPMHPDSKRGLPCNCADSLPLGMPFLDAVPCVQTVNTEFAALFLQSCDLVPKISDVVAGRAPTGSWTRHMLTGSMLKRNQEIGSGQLIFSLKVPLKGIPEIFCPA